MTGIALDIDETLSWTLGHWVEEMQSLFGNPENLSAKEIISKYRYSQNVPYWQTPSAKEWMESKRENDEFQTLFAPMPQAVEGARNLSKIVPIVVYLTVRPKSVVNGTRKWLEKHGFPNAEIIARPKDIKHENGNEWKANKLVELFPKVSGIVDDNDAILKYLPVDYKGHIFLYSHESVPSHAPANTYACPDWKIVVEKAEQVFR